MKGPASLLAVVVLWVIAFAHVLRMAYQVHGTVGGIRVPTWASIRPILFFAALGTWLLRERQG